MKLDSIAARKIVAALLMLLGLISMATAWLSFIIMVGVTIALDRISALDVSAKKIQNDLKETSLQERE